MEITSLVIIITFIVLSIAQMALGLPRVDLVVGASGPYETANVEPAGTLVTDLHDGVVHDQGKINAENGLANANLDLKNGQAKINVHGGNNAVGRLAGGELSVPKVVDFNNGTIKVGNKVYTLPTKGSYGGWGIWGSNH
ncbi:hypothetical protein MKX03_004658 [Papaver bracteatum]|nr:hypothetical protein MKX03_004658 [Papaver bracteatum]